MNLAEYQQLTAQGETSISNQIKNYLDGRKILNFRVQCGRVKVGKNYIHFAQKGVPDRFALR